MLLTNINKSYNIVNHFTIKEVQKPKAYIILFGDNFTLPYMGISYYYEAIDIRKRGAMPLLFDDEKSAMDYANNLIILAKQYTDRIKNNNNRRKAIDDVKYELEKITSTNKSIIVDLIYDILYHAGKTKNSLGLYDYIYSITSIEYYKSINNK